MGVLIFGSGGGGGGEGVDLSLDTVRPEYVLSPYRFHDSRGIRREGKIPHWNGLTQPGASPDGNKVTLAPSMQARHIPAGSYLGRDIELTPMQQGGIRPVRIDNLIYIYRDAGYIEGDRFDHVTVPDYRNDEPITPGAENIVIPVADKYCWHNITVLGDPALQPGNIREGFSIFGVDGTFTGDPLFEELSLTPGNSKTWEISTSSSAYTPYMFGFVCGSTTTDQVVSGMGYRGNATVRAYVAGRGAGNVISAVWSDNSVTLTIGDNYSYAFNTSVPYTVWVAYKSEERHA